MSKKILVALFIAVGVHSQAQQEYTLNTTAANISSAKALIDLPGLSGNTNAIIIATPLGNTKTLNPHPTGAWYYSGKWNIFNCDFAPMPVGLTYKVQYFLNPGANQFLHLVTQQTLGAEGSYIDNPALNNKPNAQFAIFPNHSPDIRAGSWLNPNEAKTGYSASAGKWYIANINGQPLQKGCAYNIVVGSGMTSTDPGPGTSTSCNCPASLPPNGQATGDLTGMYPNPMVNKILNRPLSNTPPTVGQVLKWNGTEWQPSNELGNTGNGNSYTAGLGISMTGNQINATPANPIWNASQLVGREVMTTQPTAGQVLKWGGAAWYPADDNTGTVSSAPVPAPMQTFFKEVGSGNDATGTINYQEIRPFPGLDHQVVLTKRSRLIISALITVSGVNCQLACPGSQGNLTLDVNGTRKFRMTVSVHPSQHISFTLSNYIIDLDPGNYNIVFGLENTTTQFLRGYSRYSTIMVTPL